MSHEISQLLRHWSDGDANAREQLLPLVYDELRKLAAGHMANEKPGHTLDATALVHEAYLRLVASVEPSGRRALENTLGSRLDARQQFANRRHFFAAAAEAMRRILVEHARRKQALKRGGPGGSAPIDLDRLPAPADEVDSWIDLDMALTEFVKIDADASELAKLRIFGGLSVEEAAEVLDMPRATAFRTWTYARAWLTAALSDKSENS
jgi:RNA polymerase sigma factor (TIGR02999 family)